MISIQVWPTNIIISCLFGQILSIYKFSFTVSYPMFNLGFIFFFIIFWFWFFFIHFPIIIIFLNYFSFIHSIFLSFFITDDGDEVTLMYAKLEVCSTLRIVSWFIYDSLNFVYINIKKLIEFPTKNSVDCIWL